LGWWEGGSSLLLHVFAYSLLNALRHREGIPQGLQHAQPAAWRSRLIKVAACVIQSPRRILVQLSAHWPHRGSSKQSVPPPARDRLGSLILFAAPAERTSDNSTSQAQPTGEMGHSTLSTRQPSLTRPHRRS
jgi:hypothetical protein